VRAALRCVRISWLTAHTTAGGLRSALTSSASARAPVGAQLLGERVALRDEVLEWQPVELVGPRRSWPPQDHTHP
jgi:hypothetical protein